MPFLQPCDARPAAPACLPLRPLSSLASALRFATTIATTVATTVAVSAAVSIGIGISVAVSAQTQIVPPMPQSRYGGPAALALDPPSRVARLADVSGQVWFYSPERGEWVDAVRNHPVTSADRIGTEAGARAELQLGSATVRLDAGTELEVRRLDDDHFAMHLHRGSVAVQVRDDAQAAEIELATNIGRVTLQRAGRYRLDRTSGAPGATFATVLDGQARFEGPNSGLTLAPGRRAEFWLDIAGTAQYRIDSPAVDAFADWNRARDRVIERSDGQSTARYVSPAMTGAADLDRYGRWEDDADYGPVWTPRGVDARWVPYSTGRWAWVQPWGWTWVDDAPWGFAPFHYGRWVQRRSSWCWVPGQRVLRPVYAPALVAWVGGPNVQVSITIGGQRRPQPVVGWFPLAPREVFMPGYRSSPRYIQNINTSHVTNITQITQVINNPQAPREFRNRHERDAVTLVPAAVISNRQPVAPAAAQLREGMGPRDPRNGLGPRDVRDGLGPRDVRARISGSEVQTVAPVTAPPTGPRREEARGEGRSDPRPPGRFEAQIDQRAIAPAPEGVGSQPQGPTPRVPIEIRPLAPRDELRPGEVRGQPSAGPAPIQLQPQPQPAQDGPRMRAAPMPLPQPSQPPRGDERRGPANRPEAPARVAPVMPAPPTPPTPSATPAPRPAPEPAGAFIGPRLPPLPMPTPLPRPIESARPAPQNAIVGPVRPVAPVAPVTPVTPLTRPAPAVVPPGPRPAGPESAQPPEVRAPARVGPARESRDGPREDRRDDKRVEPREAH